MSDIFEEVKRTPIPFRKKATLVMLALVILCSGFGLGASLTFNQLKDRLRPPTPMPPFVMDHLERVTKEYSLTPEQKEKVKPILETYHESFRQMFSDSMQKMAAARDGLVAAMKQVLTTEQYDKWFKDLQEREKRHWQRRPPDRRGDRGDRGSRRGRERGGPGMPSSRELDLGSASDGNRPPRWRRDQSNEVPATEPAPGSLSSAESKTE
jgi:Spy/CpxP family protein refolding chaperone